MRMISGAILILSATILYSARWLGGVLHNSVIAGSPEAGHMTVVAVILCLVGSGVLALGCTGDHRGCR